MVDLCVKLELEVGVSALSGLLDQGFLDLAGVARVLLVHRPRRITWAIRAGDRIQFGAERCIHGTVLPDGRRSNREGASWSRVATGRDGPLELALCG